MTIPEYLYSRHLKEGISNPYDTGKRNFFTRIMKKGFLKRIPYPITAFLIFLIPLALMILAYSPLLMGSTPEVMDFFLPLNFICHLIFWMSFPVTIILTKYCEDNIFWELWYELRPLIKIDDEAKYKELVASYEKRFYNRKWLSLWIIGTALVIFAYGIGLYWNLYPLGNIFTTLLALSIRAAMFSLIIYVLIISARNGYIILRTTKELRKYDYNLNPLDPDRFGGFSAIGELAIELTLTTSATLTMFLPFTIYTITTASIGGLLGTYLVILSYIVLIGVAVIILVTFFSPSQNVHYIAERERQKLLIETAKSYEKEYQDYSRYRRDVVTDSHRFDTEVQKLIERGILVTVLNNRYLETEKMRVYPFTTKTIIKLISSLLPPLIVAIMNHIISILP